MGLSSFYEKQCGNVYIVCQMLSTVILSMYAVTLGIIFVVDDLIVNYTPMGLSKRRRQGN